MDSLLIALMIAGGIVLGLLVSALWYRPRKGRFQVVRSDARWFVFRTDFGDFTIDGGDRRLILNTGKGIESVPLADIRRLHYRYREKEAPFGEVLRGLDIWDLAREYRDVTGWFEISAVVSGGSRIPLYAIGQYEPKELWSQWWFDLEKALLARIGLFTDVEEKARTVLKELQKAFSAAGRAVHLT
jgi:hypothetical protein